MASNGIKWHTVVSSGIKWHRGMAAKEIREYRTLSKKLVEVEERSKLLEKLKSITFASMKRKGLLINLILK